MKSNPENLTFDRGYHIYRWKGRRVPSVTQILDMAGEIDKTYFTEEAARRGTMVHQAIAEQLRYGPDWRLGKNTEDVAIMEPYMRAWDEFCIPWLGNAVSEQKFYSVRHGFAGTFDLYFSEEKTLVDIKTGHAPKWGELQLGGYVIGARTLGYRPIKSSILELRNDGTHDIIWSSCGPTTLARKFLDIWEPIKRDLRFAEICSSGEERGDGQDREGVR